MLRTLKMLDSIKTWKAGVDIVPSEIQVPALVAEKPKKSEPNPPRPNKRAKNESK